MPRTVLAALFLVGLTPPALAQNNPYGITDSVKVYLDTSLDIFQKYALHRRTVADWPALRETAYRQAAGATTYAALTPVFPYLFEQLNDHHGWYSFQGKKHRWKKPGAPYANPVVLGELKKNPTVRVRVIDKNIGYILLPGNSDFGMSNVSASAQALRDSICAVQNGRIKRWIIDLRLNTGGNMYPMLAGLGTLIGDGTVGGFVEQEGSAPQSWNIRQGNIYVDTFRVSRVQDKCLSPKKNVPIAVLLSGTTASAGEAVAISLVGRPNTRSFGEPTAGYTTSNNGHKLPGGGGITLAESYEIDRNRKAYTGQVLPDVEIIGGDNFTTFAADQKIKAAVKWLKKAR
ncbi:S41 family peptidase [Hymenobacter sp. BT635]|uniref:S41 family peptidase n=1 Tax=Hymenobacter nitidus TaxID=2880929 RepID=A0ABS8AAV7_9BACT|nr:S41 family peptidase [Hymenobacter nitidus]MCB2377535.1 S41 family peptidase [Hymenobacter nitidus]